MPIVRMHGWSGASVEAMMLPALRLAGTVLVEAHDEGQVGKGRYLSQPFGGCTSLRLLQRELQRNMVRRAPGTTWASTTK